MANDLLTIEEVAERTRLKVSTLRYMRQRGDGPPAAKIGRRLMYRHEDVETWLAEQFNQVQVIRAKTRKDDNA